MGGYILIVESDPVLQRRIGDTLKEARYELASEAEGAWARRSIAVRAPDAVVVDTMLSDGDGFRLAEDLRKDPDTRSTPIFFVASRFRGASHRAEARRRFAPAEYLNLPLDVNSLLALILQAVPPGEKLNRASAPLPQPNGESLPSRDGTPAEIHTATTERIIDAQAAGVTPGPGLGPPAAPAAPTLTSPQELNESLRDPVDRRERREVERTARTLAADKSEVTGNLRLIPFARLLQRLYARRSTGSLLLLRGGAKKIVSFVDGYPVAVRSNLLTECLGQILLGQKTISNEALAESIRRMQKEKRRQGEILVEMGALSPYNLTRALNEQVEAKLWEIFTWREGQFMFKQGDPPPKGATRLARAPAALILEGIRRHYDSARQVAVLDAFAGSFVGLSSNPMLRMQEMSSDPSEISFIRGISGRERLEDLLNRAEIPRDKATLLLVALAEAGVIAPAPTAVSSAGGGGGAGGSAPRRRPAQPTPTGEGAEIEISSADVVADADMDQLTGTGDFLGGFSIAPEDEHVAGATPLSSGALSMVAQTVRTQDFFWALGVERSATGEDIDRAYEALARTFHADAYRGSPDEDRKTAQEIFDRLTEAHGVLRDPEQRRAYVARLDGADAAASQPRPSAGTGTTPPASAGSATTAGNAAAQALYESGLEHLKARRHHEAVEVFRQAARLVPGAADFRAALGWSLFREAPADARAGRAALAELRRAVQIDSRNVRALHYLANYYAETGQPDLAVDELERILQIDAMDGDAADQLRRLRDR